MQMSTLKIAAISLHDIQNSLDFFVLKRNCLAVVSVRLEIYLEVFAVTNFTELQMSRFLY